MGTYLNPGNSGFIEIRNRTYVDKTGLIGLINDTIGTPEKLNCISRPRRFGKSYAAKMLCAYYDKTCESMALFDDLAIAVNEKWNGSYHQHLNRYDVILLNMQHFLIEADSVKVTEYLAQEVIEDLQKQYLDFLRNLLKDQSFLRNIPALPSRRLKSCANSLI